jgi:hypothetical protein
MYCCQSQITKAIGVNKEFNHVALARALAPCVSAPHRGFEPDFSTLLLVSYRTEQNMNGRLAGEATQTNFVFTALFRKSTSHLIISSIAPAPS